MNLTAISSPRPREFLPTGIWQLDHALGGGISAGSDAPRGLVKGALTLLSAEVPGENSAIGIRIAAHVAETIAAGSHADKRVLYLYGRGSAAKFLKVASAARPCRGLPGNLDYLARSSGICVDALAHDISKYSLVVVDDLGHCRGGGYALGSWQAQEVAAKLLSPRFEKAAQGPAILILHARARNGEIRGPEMIQHLVDVILYVNRDRRPSGRPDPARREIVCDKNRHAPCAEERCIQLDDIFGSNS